MEPNGIRIGFLGQNAQIYTVKYFLEVLEDSFEYIRKNNLRDPTAALKKFVTYQMF